MEQNDCYRIWQNPIWLVSNNEGEEKICELGRVVYRQKGSIILSILKIYFIDFSLDTQHEASSFSLSLKANLQCLYNPSFCTESDKNSQHLMKVLLSSVDRETCIRTYQVIYSAFPYFLSFYPRFSSN